MAVIPLKQSVDVYKKQVSDGWGHKTVGKTPSMTLKCRYQEGIDREESLRYNMNDLVLNGKFIFDKYPEITLEDRLEFTDEHGIVHSFEPRNIDVIRWLNGKPMFTVVLV
jgi:hypothetical protein